MQIYLLRHGQAGPAGAGLPDSERRLTAAGEQQIQSVAHRTLTGVGGLSVLSSPYLRALQSARLATEAAGLATEIITTSALTPDSTPSETWADVRTHRLPGPVLLVGHEPLFSALLAYLLGAPDITIEFGTGTMACIELYETGPRPRGALKWMIPARFV
jgi:phosphohistidine phosphatase SixA